MNRNRKKVYTQIKLTGIQHSGKSFGNVGNRRIYVNYGIPGEVIDASGVQKEGDYLRGEVSNVHNLSSDRNVPFCRHFGLCGGCNWQHMHYDAQLRWKHYLLLRALEKHGIEVTEIPPVKPSPQVTGYRHKLEFSFSARRWYYEDEGRVEDPLLRQAMGFHPSDNPFKVLDISECHLLEEPGLAIAVGIRKFTLENGFIYYDPKEQTGLLRSLAVRRTSTGEMMLIVVFSRDEPESIAKLMAYIHEIWTDVRTLIHTVTNDIRQNYTDGDLVIFPGTAAFITERCNHLNFRISPRSFYQPNPLQAEKIFRHIQELADLKGTELVYDLYCGIGSISLHLAGKAMKVIGLEGSADAIEDARHNALINGFHNAEFICGDILHTFTTGFIAHYGNPDVIVLDPPRSGTLIEIKKTILTAAPGKIIYLSCDPLSLARDLKMLSRDYKIVLMQPYDQFPHTHHLETLVLLERK